jgi:hypothetical protein
VVSVLAPISWSWADDRFADVASTNGHHANINAIAEAGITLGCTDAAHYCPSDLVRRDQMASFLARLGGLGKNARVANGRGATSAYCRSVEALPGRFDDGPCRNTISRLDVAGGTGYEPSMALGANGFPVVGVFRYDGVVEAPRLTIVRCDDAVCSSSTSTSLGYAETNSALSIAIGSDGNVIAVYTDADSIDVHVTHCRDQACSSADETNFGADGDDTSVAILNDGLPVVTYRSSGLWIQRCLDQACASRSPVVPLETGAVGEDNAVAIGVDGVPIVSYFDRTNGDLKVVRCATTSCDAGAAPVTLSTEGNAGSHSSIAIGIDGKPVIAHYRFDSGHLAITRCADVTCSAAASTAYFDGFSGGAGRNTSIAIREDGIPFVSYFDAYANTARLIHCDTAACTSAPNAQWLEAGGGRGTSLTFGIDGVPIVAYGAGYQLKFARVPTYVPSI